MAFQPDLSLLVSPCHHTLCPQRGVVAASVVLCWARLSCWELNQSRGSIQVSVGLGINCFLLMCFLRSLQGLASCFGICAINHLEETLAKLEDFVRSDVFKKSVGLFSIFKVRGLSAS